WLNPAPNVSLCSDAGQSTTPIGSLNGEKSISIDFSRRGHATASRLPSNARPNSRRSESVIAKMGFLNPPVVNMLYVTLRPVRSGTRAPHSRFGCRVGASAAA
ncbi:unnamed protein product, partial [Ectocarpus sp. 12 AP-2014]